MKSVHRRLMVVVKHLMASLADRPLPTLPLDAPVYRRLVYSHYVIGLASYAQPQQLFLLLIESHWLAGDSHRCSIRAAIGTSRDAKPRPLRSG